MAANVQVDLIRLSRNGADQAVVHIKTESESISLSVSNGLLTHMVALLPSEAQTIGEQLIAAGKAEG